MKLASLVFALSALFPLLAASNSAHADPLSLDDYLKQVRGESLSVRSSTLSSEGSLLRSSEGGLVTTPSLFATGQLASDAKQSPFFRYDKVLLNTYSLGVQQLTSFGLQYKVSYNLTFTDYVGLNFPGSVTTFYEGRPALEISQSLWKNGFGSETRALRDQLEAQALLTHFTESFKIKAALAEAENAYWNLALNRQNLAIAKNTLARANTLLEWSTRRARLELADKSDVYQSEAIVELRKLQLKAAEDLERSASRAFNAARNVASETVTETLATLDPAMLQNLPTPARAELRDDVKAAEQGSRVAEAAAAAGRSRNQPQLDLFATGALNSRDTSMNTALSNSFKSDFPTLAGGLKFSMPLDPGASSDARAGWERERLGAEKTFAARRFQQDVEWADLNQRLEEAKRRLELTLVIEAAQKKKVLYERERLTRGRTTTHQAILFESDYSDAQLGRLRTQAEILGIVARMKTFTPSNGATK